MVIGCRFYLVMPVDKLAIVMAQGIFSRKFFLRYSYKIVVLLSSDMYK